MLDLNWRRTGAELAESTPISRQNNPGNAQIQILDLKTRGFMFFDPKNGHIHVFRPENLKTSLLGCFAGVISFFYPFSQEFWANTTPRTSR